MNNKATVTVNSKRAEVPLGTLLSALIENDTPCGGHGSCGKCKVYADGALSAYSEIEEKMLSEAERRAGIRLACQTKILGDAEIIFGKAEGGADALRGAEVAPWRGSATAKRRRKIRSRPEKNLDRRAAFVLK